MDYKNLLLIIQCSHMIGISVGEHVKRGHYPNITSDKCGITKKGWRLDPCLNRSSRNIRSLRVIHGRDAHTGEFPFIIGYKYKQVNYFQCTGSILNNKWILIAAHCLTALNDTNTCQVYVGYTKFPSDIDKYYTCENIFIHKEYKAGSPHVNDIGLIKLKEAIIMDEKQHYFKINSVCLPEPNIVNNEYEFALFAGWGKLNDYDLNLRQLQAVTFKIFPVNGCVYAEDDKKIVTVENPNLANAGEGDSGGPLIQYVDGRAVVIGVASFGFYNTECGHYITLFTRVSKFIDFINNIINANK